jgi:hypothetical protein
VSTSSSRAQRLRRNPDDPALWVGVSPLVDLGDPKLRVRAQSLVQMRNTPSDKASAIYTFVRRMPLSAGVKLRLRSARDVLERGHGDAIDKATLLLALMRLAGLPARVRFAAASAAALRGLPGDVSSMPRPFVEVCIGGRWVCTDTYIFDSAYVAAARQRLRTAHQEYGYGVHAEGATLWESHRDAYLLGPDAAEELLTTGTQAWRDPLEFARSLRGSRRLAHWWRALRWNLSAGVLQRRLQAIRSEAQRGRRRAPAGVPADSATQPVTQTGHSEVSLVGATSVAGWQ